MATPTPGRKRAKLSPGVHIPESGVPNFGNAALGYAAVTFIVIGIGGSLGGPTGYAINPARDLGPRIAYSLMLPIKGKGNGNWGYAWVPVVGPLLGGLAPPAPGAVHEPGDHLGDPERHRGGHHAGQPGPYRTPHSPILRLSPAVALPSCAILELWLEQTGWHPA